MHDAFWSGKSKSTGIRTKDSAELRLAAAMRHRGSSIHAPSDTFSQDEELAVGAGEIRDLFIDNGSLAMRLTDNVRYRTYVASWML